MKINTKNRMFSYKRKSVKDVMSNRLVYEKAKRNYEQQMVAQQERMLEEHSVEEQQPEQQVD